MNQFVGKGTLSLFGLLGAIVILLWGVQTIRKGVEKIILPHINASSIFFRNRFYALLAGICGAAMLQSSTGLVLIISSIVTRVTVPLSISLAFVLGADVGTAIATQLFAFNIKSLGPLLLFLGFFIQRTTKKEFKRYQVGQILMGFGFVLYGLSSIDQISSVIKESEILSTLLASVLLYDVALSILIAILLTWLSHSSLAIVLMTLELVMSGVVSLELGIALVLGANIGACLPAYIDSIGLPAESRRLTVGNLIFRMTGGILVLPFLRYIILFSSVVSIDPARYVLLFHLFFNFTLTLGFIFFTRQVGNFIVKIVPEPERLSHKGVKTKFLRTGDIADPKLAIMNLKKEVCNMSDNLYVMLDCAYFSIESPQEIKRIGRIEDKIDALHRSITKYLQRIYSLALSDEDSFHCIVIQAYSTDIEQAADIVANNFTETLETKHAKHISISKAYSKQLEAIFSMLKQNMNISQEVFRNLDVSLAEQLIENKEKFKHSIIQYSINHKQEILKGDADSMNISSLYLDMLSDVRRIHAHVSAIAYPILDRQ